MPFSISSLTNVYLGHYVKGFCTFEIVPSLAIAPKVAKPFGYSFMMSLGRLINDQDPKER